MKRLSPLILVAFLFAASACKTAPETLAYRTLGSIAITVQTASQVYYEYRDNHPGAVPNSLDDQVKAAYKQYQAAFSVAETAQRLAKASGQPPNQAALDAVIKASSEFTSLVSVANPNYHATP